MIIGLGFHFVKNSFAQTKHFRAFASNANFQVISADRIFYKSGFKVFKVSAKSINFFTFFCFISLDSFLYAWITNICTNSMLLFVSIVIDFIIICAKNENPFALIIIIQI